MCKSVGECNFGKINGGKDVHVTKKSRLMEAPLQKVLKGNPPTMTTVKLFSWVRVGVGVPSRVSTVVVVVAAVL